ncbi:hypothetical protein ACFSHT_05865 [Paraburkholderia silviterrae]|uniref:Glycosyltransferase subfamily 4-like N-terminal domain-containing protein n=1 Tax=Paraburkholderia silviterrae TaxID=2528715 RepID=A0A4R5MC05_9BURK|nr:hypothetical protein [Paraburkholderia silviterrae]TDG24432.1 hypothetical protein EYW47_07655 [Paraburkholderia silviterrae]
MKILIICEHFFPLTGAQALQATKVADALSLAGCEVRILCGARQVQGAESAYPVYFVETVPYGGSNNILDRVVRRVRHEFNDINAEGEWINAMVEKAIEMEREFKPDVIMTQSTPFRSHLVGLRLPSEMREKWVAYFSDLWPLCLTPYPYRTTLSNILSFVQLRSLGRVLGTARKIIMSSDESVFQITRKFPHIDPEKFFSVAHIGTPPSGLAPSAMESEHYASRFVHVGRLTRERTCPELVTAIGKLVEEEGTSGARFPGFTFVGWVDQEFRERCVELERSGAIEFVGDVDPTVAQSICTAAGVLVVIEANMPESPFLPSKFSDYAMLRKPILSISPPGPIRRYLSRHGGGVATGHNARDIQDAMRSLIKNKHSTSDGVRLAALFDAGHVAQKYIEIFGRQV